MWSMGVIAECRAVGVRRRYLIRLVAIISFTVLLAHGTSSASTIAPSEALVRLQGHVLGAIPSAGPPPASRGLDTDPIVLTLVLGRTDQAGFDRYLHDVYDAQSPDFRRFLGQPEITARFGPTQKAYDDVLAYLEQNGFGLVHGSANR